MRNNRGFSLMEVLIVLVILAVIAGLAVPIYFTQVEKSKSLEALRFLQATRESMFRHFAQRGTYANAVFAGGDNVLTFNIDFNPNVEAVSGGQISRFAYVLGGLAPATFTITATRVAVAGDPAPAVLSTVTLNQAGTVVKTGAYL